MTAPEVIACCLVSGLFFGWPAAWLYCVWRLRRLRGRSQPYRGGMLTEWGKLEGRAGHGAFSSERLRECLEEELVTVLVAPGPCSESAAREFASGFVRRAIENHP